MRSDLLAGKSIVISLSLSLLPLHMMLISMLHVMQELIQELGGVLLQLSESCDASVHASLKRLTIETSTLMGCIKQFNVPVYKATLQGRLDEDLHPAAGEKLDAAWFSSLPVPLCFFALDLCFSMVPGVLGFAGHNLSQNK